MNLLIHVIINGEQIGGTSRRSWEHFPAVAYQHEWDGAKLLSQCHHAQGALPGCISSHSQCHQGLCGSVHYPGPLNCKRLIPRCYWLHENRNGGREWKVRGWHPGSWDTQFLLIYQVAEKQLLCDDVNKCMFAPERAWRTDKEIILPKSSLVSDGFN